MQFSIILNELAGSGNAKKVWQRIEPQLKNQNIQYQVMTTQYAGHAQFLAEQIVKHTAQPQDTVILVVGGDGTLHQVLNGVLTSPRHLKSQIPLAYVPAGSGNDFARGLKMASDPDQALRQILNCHEAQLVDIGTYSEEIKHETGYFINNIGIGFDAAVVSHTNVSAHKKRFNKYHVGSLSYMASIFSVLYNQEPFQLMVQMGNHRDLYQKAFLVTTSNHPYFGGGVSILPTATVHSSELELIVVERKNWLMLLWVAILLLFQRHLKSRWVHHYKGRQIHVTTTSLEFGQIDGEVMGNRFFDLAMGIQQYPFWIDTSIK